MLLQPSRARTHAATRPTRIPPPHRHGAARPCFFVWPLVSRSPPTTTPRTAPPAASAGLRPPFVVVVLIIAMGGAGRVRARACVPCSARARARAGGGRPQDFVRGVPIRQYSGDACDDQPLKSSLSRIGERSLRIYRCAAPCRVVCVIWCLFGSV